MRLIDADALKAKIEEMQACEPEYAFHFLNDAQNPSTEWECVEDLIENAPTIEAEPVRHGAWTKGYCKDEEMNCVFCSACGKSAYWDTDYGQQLFPYCPYCGAKMDG